MVGQSPLWGAEQSCTVLSALQLHSSGHEWFKNKPRVLSWDYPKDLGHTYILEICVRADHPDALPSKHLSSALSKGLTGTILTIMAGILFPLAQTWALPLPGKHIL